MLRINGHLATVFFFCLIFTNSAFAQIQNDKTDAVNGQSDDMVENSQVNPAVPMDTSSMPTSEIDKEFPSIDTTDIDKEFTGIDTTDVDRRFPGIDTKDVEKSFQQP